MNLRNTLILFLVFVSLAVFAWTLRDRESKQFGNAAPEPTPGPMWDFKADAVNEVVVSRGSDEYTLTRDGAGWLVDGEATNDEVDGLVGRIAEPTILRVLPEDRDPDVYGFDTPALTITFRVSDTETVIFRGDQVPTTSDYYMRLGDDGPISIWSGFDIDRLEEWLDAPPLVPTPTAETGDEDDGATDEDAESGTDDFDEGVDEGADSGGDAEGADEEIDDADLTATAESGSGSEPGGTATSESTPASTSSSTAASTAAATSKASATARSTPTATVEPTPSDGEEARP